MQAVWLLATVLLPFVLAKHQDTKALVKFGQIQAWPAPLSTFIARHIQKADSPADLLAAHMMDCWPLYALVLGILAMYWLSRSRAHPSVDRLCNRGDGTTALHQANMSEQLRPEPQDQHRAPDVVSTKLWPVRAKDKIPFKPFKGG